MPLILLGECPHHELIDHLWSTLPAKVRAITAQCREADEQLWPRVRAGRHQTGVSEVLNGLPTMDLRRSQWTHGPSVFFHEVGHLLIASADGVPLALVDATRWAGWVKFYSAHLRWMPTQYARTGPSEGIAECSVSRLSGHWWAGYAPLNRQVVAAYRTATGL